MNKRSEKPKFYASILAGIEQKYGKLTADLVIEEATAEDHPLHGEFEWRDEIAGRIG